MSAGIQAHWLLRFNQRLTYRRHPRYRNDPGEVEDQSATAAVLTRYGASKAHVPLEVITPSRDGLLVVGLLLFSLASGQ